MKQSMENIELDLTKLSLEEQAKYAKLFAEGSNSLEELLKYFWQNGINSYACCAGHNESIKFGSLMVSSSKPYVFFEVGNLTDTQLENLLVRLSVPSNDLDDIQFDYNFVKDRYTSNRTERTGFVVTFKQNNEENFVKLLTIIKRVMKNLVLRFDVIKDAVDNNKSEINRIKSDDLKDFISSAVELKNVSLSEYQRDSQELKYDRIALNYRNSSQITYSTNDNLKKAYISVVDDKTGEVDVKTLAVGYVTEFANGKFYTTTDGFDCIEVSAHNAKNMKHFVEDKKLNKFSENYTRCSFEEVFEELNLRNSTIEI